MKDLMQDKEPASGLIRQLLVVAGDIKLSHTVFAMPFAVLAMFMAAADADRLPSVVEAGLLVLCMIFARTSAMSFNRWADADFDVLNPRTQSRAIPSMRIKRGFMLGVATGSSFGFIAACAGFRLIYDNSWPVLLSPLVLIYLAAYSYTKRFTSLSHLCLGLALAISPIAATIAIEPGFLGKLPIYLLATAVLCWVAGFDIIYAIQDCAIDRELGLHSIPACMGRYQAKLFSLLMHALTILLLISMNHFYAAFDQYFTIGCILAVLLLVIEHVLIWKSHAQYMTLSFFTPNSMIGVVICITGIIDIVFSQS